MPNDNRSLNKDKERSNINIIPTIHTMSIISFLKYNKFCIIILYIR